MIERHIVPGTNQDYALLIKVGQGGSVFGYQNKYLNLAHEIHDKYGLTVVCSPNPDGATNQIADDIKFVNTLFKTQNSPENNNNRLKFFSWECQRELRSVASRAAKFRR